MEKDLITKSVDFIFSENKAKYLIPIILIALILRIILAYNVGPLADEMNVAIRSINIFNANTINSIDQSHTFYYLGNIFYILFGKINLLTARFTSIFFGILSILMIYLITRKLFNYKLAIISSFLIAISGFQIRYSLAEMDITMAFYVLLSNYCFILFIKENKKYMLILSSIFLALAIAIKSFAVMFFLSYFFFIIYYLYKDQEFKQKYLNKSGLKLLIIFSIIIFISTFPVIIANYLLYKDKGLVDLQVARFLGISKETYKGLGGIDQPFNPLSIFAKDGGLSAAKISFSSLDPIITLLAIIGLFIAYKKDKIWTMFLFLWFLFPFIFITGTAWLTTHFVFFTLIFSIFASFTLLKIKELIPIKNILIILLLIIMLINIFLIWNNISTQTAITKARNFAIDNIDENSLVITDSRIFRGRIAFIFNDKHYLETNYLSEIFNSQEQLTGLPTKIKTYFVECVPDDCGWGIAKITPELNETSEQILKLFQNISISKTTILGGGGMSEETNQPYFNIYETTLNLKPITLNLVDQTHTFYFYPVGWKMKDKIYDLYEVNGFFDNFLNLIAYIIFYLEILLEILSPLIIIYFFKK